MICERIKLNGMFPNVSPDAELTSYVPENEFIKRKSVIICAGGAYSCRCRREEEPVALALVARGFNAFVLSYSTSKQGAHYPTQLIEASAAVSYIRRNSEKYNAVKDKIFIMGFSAGGHLAASLGTLWNEKVIEEKLGIEYGENRPSGMILCYPVISFEELYEPESFFNLLGENKDEKLWKKLSLENSVGEHTSPAFIWHTLEDEGIPVESSMLFAKALRENNIPFELHVYPTGGHGLALANEESKMYEADKYVNKHVQSWIELCARWIYDCV